MPVSNELHTPTTEELFEEMCFHLYKAEWKDPSCNRLGGAGQGQFGLDIMGHFDGRELGVQCKHYVKKAFTLGTIEKDIQKADEAGIAVDHVIFATSAPNKADLVKQVRELSAQRRRAGKFTVSVDFWAELSALLRLHKNVAREYIPDFPGGTLLAVQETAIASLELVRAESRLNAPMRTEVSEIHAMVTAIYERPTELPRADGGEAEPLIAGQLDLAREKLLSSKPDDALELLARLGDPAGFRDTFSRFRWHTNQAAALLLKGQKEDAASEYLKSFSVDSQLEKAWRNKAHAYALLGETDNALAASTEGVQRYPDSAALWALYIAAQQMAGSAEPEKGVPEAMMATTDVAFTLSQVRFKQGRLEESYDLIRRCVETDSPTLETKRSYLAAALTWATEEPVGAHFGQFTAMQREALADAIRRLEPLEALLGGLQVDEVSLELSSNVSAALMLLDDLPRARRIANNGLLRHPLSEGLLRVRIAELNVAGDIAGLRALGAGRLTELPSSALVALADIAGAQKDLEWHKEVFAILRERPHSERQMEDLELLSVDATWHAGSKEEALAAGEVLATQQPNHVMTHVMLSRMLESVGEALRSADECSRAAQLAQADGATFADMLIVADLLCDRGLYGEAASLYGRIVLRPGNNPITQRYLECLVASDQRRKAQEVLEILSTDVRHSSTFRRIEANLARRMGDWSRMREVLRTELSRTPSSAEIATGYVGALHRIGVAAAKELSDYLASDPTFDGSNARADVEFGKYQAQHGFKNLALRRLYRVFRSHPNDAELAGYFLARVMLGSHDLIAPAKVCPGATVHLRNEGETRHIAVDFDDGGDGAWPELVAADSDVSTLLQGKATGDRVTLPRGLGDVEYEVTGLSSTFMFAADRAHQLIAASANPGGPLWSVNIEKSDGQLNIQPVLAEARAKTRALESALAEYTENRFPLATLAKTIGASTLDLMLDWPSNKASLFVSIGTQEERDAGFAALLSGAKRFVIDLPTLGDLVATGVFRDVVPLLGRPLVPTTVREELAGILEYRTLLPSRMSIREEGGKYYREELSIEEHRRRLDLLREMLDCIDELCDVTPVAGTTAHGPENEVLNIALDDATLDAAYLALEREAILLSEDGGLRLHVPMLGLVDTMGLQPLLMLARDRGLLTNDAYVNVIAGKVARGQDFISVRAEDLVVLSRRSIDAVSPYVAALFETFRGKSLDVASGVRVSGFMLGKVAEFCRPAVIREYFELAMASLQFGRPDLAADIQVVLQGHLKDGIAKLPRKRQAVLRRSLESLLQPPIQRQTVLVLTPVCFAIKTLFR